MRSRRRYNFLHVLFFARGSQHDDGHDFKMVSFLTARSTSSPSIFGISGRAARARKIGFATVEFSGAAKIIERFHSIARHHHAVGKAMMLEGGQRELDIFGIIFHQQNAFGLPLLHLPFLKLR